MIFPITAKIQPVAYGKQEAIELMIDGNAGLLPPCFQYNLRTKDGSVVDNKVVQLNDKQWEGWTTQKDEPYILECVAELVGVVLT